MKSWPCRASVSSSANIGRQILVAAASEGSALAWQASYGEQKEAGVVVGKAPPKASIVSQPS